MANQQPAGVTGTPNGPPLVVQWVLQLPRAILLLSPKHGLRLGCDCTAGRKALPRRRTHGEARAAGGEEITSTSSQAPPEAAVPALPEVAMLPHPSSAPRRMQRIHCQLPLDAAPGKVVTVYTAAGDAVRVPVPEGGSPGAVVEFSVPEFPRRVYAHATDEPGRYKLAVPDGLEGGEAIRAMTPDGIEVQMVVPNEATPGAGLVFKVWKERLVGQIPCVPAVSTGVNGHYELTAPNSASLIAGTRAIKVRTAAHGQTRNGPTLRARHSSQVLLPNESLAILQLPEGIEQGATLSFAVSSGAKEISALVNRGSL